MRRIVPLLALALALTLLVPASVAQPGRPTPIVGGVGEDHGEDDREKGEKDEGSEDRESRPAAFGEFSLLASQAVDGDYVDFSYNETSVTGFSVAGVPILDLTVASAGDEDDDDERLGVDARGAVVRVVTSSFRLQVHDNPEAVTKLRTDGVATFLFASGATLTQVGEERVRFTVGNLTGILRGDDLQVAGRNVIAEGEILLLVHTPRGSFDQHREKIGEAVARRHVGAEVSVDRRNGNVTEDLVSYGNVTMRTLRAERGNLTLEIEGHGFDGRVVVLNADGRIVGASKADDLTILFDGEPIAHASTIADILDPDDDGLKAEYYVVFDLGTETFQVLVSVPHYSVHILSVMTALPQLTPSIVLGVTAGILVLAASGFVLFRRK